MTGFTTPPLPPGRPLDLPGRGTTFIRERPGPPGAPTVLLLHGWTASADLNWFPTYAPLARRFRVLAVDHRGHGRGIRSRERFRLADCADDAAAVVAALGTGPVIAVGYSMGGPIAQLLWHRHRESVAGLVLCATSASFASQAGERMAFLGVGGLAQVARVTPTAVIGRVSERLMTGPIEQGPFGNWVRSELALANPRTLLEAGAAIGRFRSHDWVSQIDVPTAVVVTTADRVVPPRRQERLAEQIPHATVHRVDGDHAVCVTGAERFVPTLRRACESVAARAAHVPA
ncbi:MAG: alpha/beta hydrolase [Acidimicrobiales bacterium]